MLILHNLYGSSFTNRDLILGCIQKKLIDTNYTCEKITDVIGVIEILEFMSKFFDK